MRIEFSQKMTINAMTSEVWRVIAHEFDSVAVWSSGLSHSRPLNNEFAPDGKNICGRICVPLGKAFVSTEIREAFNYYDEESMRFGYSATGLPSFFHSIENNWQVKAVSENQSTLEICPVIEIKFFPGILIKPMLKFWGRRTLAELKYYIENGQPHPRKIKAMKK